MDRVLQDKINRMIGYLKVYPDVYLAAAEEKFQAHEDKVEKVTSMTRKEHEAEFSKSIYAKIVKVLSDENVSPMGFSYCLQSEKINQAIDAFEKNKDVKKVMASLDLPLSNRQKTELVLSVFKDVPEKIVVRQGVMICEMSDGQVENKPIYCVSSGKEIVDILNPEHPACAFAKKSSLFDLDKQPIHFIKNGKKLVGVLFGNDLIEGMSEQDREQKTDEIPPKVVGKRKTSPKKTKEPKTRG